jgi:hypothetical protein
MSQPQQQQDEVDIYNAELVSWCEVALLDASKKWSITKIDAHSVSWTPEHLLALSNLYERNTVNLPFARRVVSVVGTLCEAGDSGTVELFPTQHSKELAIYLVCDVIYRGYFTLGLRNQEMRDHVASNISERRRLEFVKEFSNLAPQIDETLPLLNIDTTLALRINDVYELRHSLKLSRQLITAWRETDGRQSS